MHARSPAGAHVVGRRCAGVSGSRSTEAHGHVASSAHRGTRGPQSSWDDGTHPSPVCLIPQRRGMLFGSLWVLCTGKAVPAGPDREPAGHRRGELRAPAALGTCRMPDPAELRLRPVLSPSRKGRQAWPWPAPCPAPCPGPGRTPRPPAASHSRFLPPQADTSVTCPSDCPGQSPLLRLEPLRASVPQMASRSPITTNAKQ